MRTLLLPLLALSPAVLAAPGQLGHQGRLLDENGMPMEGTHALDFRLYDTSESGNILWEESHEVEVLNGYYSLVLGADEVNNPIDTSLLSDNDLFLELTVDAGDALSPRQAFSAVPFARVATQAENLSGGKVDASEVRINGDLVVDGSGAWVGADTQLTEADVDAYCANNGYALETNLSAVATSGSYTDLSDAPVLLTEADVDAYCANNGYALAANLAAIATSGDWSDLTGVPGEFADGIDADSLAGFSCQDGDVLVWDAVLVDWTCAFVVDSDTQLTESEVDTFVSNNGYALESSLAALATSGDWSDLTGVPTGLDDGDDDTHLSASEVEGYITDGALDLASGTTLGGAAISTGAHTSSLGWTDLTGVPTGLDDGDDDTQLTESEVDTFVSNNGYALESSLAALATSGSFNDLSDTPEAIANGVVGINAIHYTASDTFTVPTGINTLILYVTAGGGGGSDGGTTSITLADHSHSVAAHTHNSGSHTHSIGSHAHPGGSHIHGTGSVCNCTSSYGSCCGYSGTTTSGGSATTGQASGSTSTPQGGATDGTAVTTDNTALSGGSVTHDGGEGGSGGAMSAVVPVSGGDACDIVIGAGGAVDSDGTETSITCSSISVVCSGGYAGNGDGTSGADGDCAVTGGTVLSEYKATQLAPGGGGAGGSGSGATGGQTGSVAIRY